MGNELFTRYGTADLDDFKPSMVNIEDIAHSLARQCRFNGHVQDFYSVAQHSILVSYACPDELALEGLLHDAHEAYTGDIIRPVKRQLFDVNILEAEIQAVIRYKFGIMNGFRPELKKADDLILELELRTFFGDRKLIAPYGYQAAEKRFIERFLEISAGIDEDREQQIYEIRQSMRYNAKNDN